MEPKKYEYIDSLRGIAIMLVVMVHVGYNVFPPRFINKIVENGQLGVQLFFIVSAFTLVMSYQNRLNEKNRTTNFFIRRFFRIAPMYHLAILFVTVDILLGWNIYNPRLEEIDVVELLTNISFTNGFVPAYINRYVPGGWSIAVEFSFYLLLPLLCLKIRNLNSSVVFVIVSLLLSTAFNRILVKTLFVDDPTYFVYHNITSQLPVFALGIFAYWALYDKNREVKPATILMLAATILLFCYFVVPYHFLYSLFFAFLLIALAKRNYKLLSNRLLANIGKLSFSMYLVHFVFVNLYDFSVLQNSMLPELAVVAINFAIEYIAVWIATFLLAQLTYRFIEVPGQNWGRKIIKNLELKYQSIN
ncbi:acyltransferase family protein [Viscerimonas tarda]